MKRRWVGETEEERNKRKKEYNRLYYASHRDKCRSLNRRWCAEHREVLRVKERRRWQKRNGSEYRKLRRARYKKHPEEILAQARAYRNRNVEACKERSREYYRQNRERLRADGKVRRLDPVQRSRQKARRSKHYRLNREVYLAQARNREARSAAAPGKHTPDDIRAIWERQKRKCAVPRCGCVISRTGKNKYHVDHIRALINGGSNWPSNLQILCRTHNTQKQDQDEYEWAQEHRMLFPK